MQVGLEPLEIGQVCRAAQHPKSCKLVRTEMGVTRDRPLYR